MPRRLGWVAASSRIFVQLPSRLPSSTRMISNGRDGSASTEPMRITRGSSVRSPLYTGTTTDTLAGRLTTLSSSVADEPELLKRIENRFRRDLVAECVEVSVDAEI